MGIERKETVTALRKVGSKTAKLLENLEIRTVEDLLYHFPAYYRDFRAPQKIAQAEEGKLLLVRARLTMPPRWIRRFGKTTIFTFEVADGTGVLDINIFNLPFLFEKYVLGQEYLFYGKAKLFRHRMQLDNPQVFEAQKAPQVLAYYPLTAGVSQHMLRSAVKTALETVDMSEEYSPAFREATGIWEDLEDFKSIHMPSNPEESARARKSLAKKELLLFHRMLELSAAETCQREPLVLSEQTVEKFLAKLPFVCTGAQKRAMHEILADFQKPRPANRLVQGDVGSGKTAVALYGAYAILKAGGQSALLAPTELLADQHYASAARLFGNRVRLLKGSTSAAEREDVLRSLENGETSLLIGTHALLYGALPFQNLQLLMVDEQHRFGVAQRAALLQEHPSAHMIAFSATPIPRSMALILYGNADISVLDELPPGRVPPATHLIGRAKRDDMYAWIAKKTQEGEKAYLVCPLLEPSEGIDACSVLELQEELAQKHPKMHTEVMHGRMNALQKQEIMERFRRGEIQALISTTVVEVGVDVQDAHIIVVENADRFGLAQLHQLRGRVGRGGGKSYCYLLSDGSGLERLKILKNCHDGFEIARRDLALRGSGELLGQRQHGAESFRVVDLLEDAELFLEAKKTLGMMKKTFPRDYAALTARAAQNLQCSQGQRGSI